MIMWYEGWSYDRLTSPVIRFDLQWLQIALTSVWILFDDAWAEIQIYCPARKHRLIPGMNMNDVHSTILEFYSKIEELTAIFRSKFTVIFCTCYRCSPSKWRERYGERYMIPTVKHLPSQMLWGAMSVADAAAIYMLIPKLTMGGCSYFNLFLWEV